MIKKKGQKADAKAAKKTDGEERIAPFLQDISLKPEETPEREVRQHRES
jgi:hypothetical protein